MLYFLMGVCFIIIVGCNNNNYQPPTDPLFTTITAKKSGLFFRNDLIEDSAFNELNYRNFYNGGGVSIGDVNNDGLEDIFLTANQLPDKLFLNLGDFKFKDITLEAGITNNHKWSTGATMVDINNDGLLDIYVCTAGNHEGDNRLNELFINNGDLTFTESAKQYNLQQAAGFHTHASFFDYDRDGDLDVYLLNNDCLMPVERFGSGNIRMIGDEIKGDQLLRNNGGVFENVTESAGIYYSNIGFGLGISTGDLNDDGWPDIYISNDFFEKDYLYLNNKDGTFFEVSDSSLRYMSQSSMGADMADINNDGMSDIFTTDMLPQDDYRLKKNTFFETFETFQTKYNIGLHKQILANMLHLNMGDGNFTEIGRFAGVHATDWSWGALIADLDNDGWKDIFVCNGMYLDITDQDYINFIADKHQKQFFSEDKNTLDYKRLKTMIPSMPISNYAFANQKNLKFENKAHDWGLGKPGYSNGAAYADLDNDGDLDLVVNNVNEEVGLFKNTTSDRGVRHFLKINFKGDSSNRFGIGTKVTLYADAQQQLLENYPSRGFQSSVPPILTFGLGNISTVDSLIVQWSDGKIQRMYSIRGDTTLTVNYALASFEKAPTILQVTNKAPYQEIMSLWKSSAPIAHENDFNDFNAQRLLPHYLSNAGPKIISGDINKDGLIDLFMTGAKNEPAKLAFQLKNGQFEVRNMDVFSDDKLSEGTCAALFDIDGDGDLDILQGNGGNLDPKESPLLKPQLYLNDGKGNFSHANAGGVPNIFLDASCIRVADYDKDGDIDVFIGGRCIPGKYGLTPKSYLLRNDKGILTDVTNEIAPELTNMGMVTDARWADIDGSGNLSLMVVGDYMPFTCLSFSETGKLQVNRTVESSAGWWNCLNACDMDADGDIDFVAGNLGTNSIFKADAQHPLSLWVGDYDNNGLNESLITYYKTDGKSYLHHSYQDIMSQLPFLKKRFLRFSDYAGKTLPEIIERDKLNNAKQLSANYLQTALFINDGKGNFSITPLPAQAQFSPVYAIATADINEDGLPDIILGGNQYGTKPDAGIYDGLSGGYFINKGNAHFEYMSPAKSGLFFKGMVRSIEVIKTGTYKNLISVGINNDKVRLFIPAKE